MPNDKIAIKNRDRIDRFVAQKSTLHEAINRMCSEH